MAFSTIKGSCTIWFALLWGCWWSKWTQTWVTGLFLRKPQSWGQLPPNCELIIFPPPSPAIFPSAPAASSTKPIQHGSGPQTCVEHTPLLSWAVLSSICPGHGGVANLQFPAPGTSFFWEPLKSFQCSYLPPGLGSLIQGRERWVT